jgi:hypothetical protein
MLRNGMLTVIERLVVRPRKTVFHGVIVTDEVSPESEEKDDSTVR